LTRGCRLGHVAEHERGREEVQVEENPAGESPDVMGGPEPDEQRADVMGGAEGRTDEMGGPEPDEERTDLMRGPEPGR
jgi:hypothetical protein